MSFLFSMRFEIGTTIFVGLGNQSESSSSFFIKLEEMEGNFVGVVGLFVFKGAKEGWGKARREGFKSDVIKGVGRETDKEKRKDFDEVAVGAGKEENIIEDVAGVNVFFVNKNVTKRESEKGVGEAEKKSLQKVGEDIRVVG